MTITRKLKICGCGCGKEGYIYARKMLKECDRRVNPPKQLKKVSKKQLGKIKENGNYYRAAIAQNIIRNKGKCRCDECGSEIKEPKGRNVAHIVSAGANAALYLEPENNNVLCLDCVIWEESGDRTTMKLYQQREDVRQRLTAKYYQEVRAGK